ncbi:MAG TPA: GH1 family beta-glucosidase [Streptosporangiaceae bacterium]|nr:GH1 family beta-glucosidase [Streptosporangiaceae bacterium]
MSEGRDAFPDGFAWGVSTAAYQIEGAVAEDGRGLSIWDTFSHQPGRTTNGDTGDIACDSYHRMDEDLGLLSQLGVTGYRFSIAWPRIQPDGRGTPNQAGLDYYSRLVDQLLERGITPLVTLYHWDLPQPLQDKGGWATRDTADLFADYAATVAGALGDRVTRWITLNEPWVAASMGYRSAEHAPGIADPRQYVAAVHHLLLAHGKAVAAVRSAAPSPAEVGVTLNMAQVYPADPASHADRELAADIDADLNGVFLDPLTRGSYPARLGEGQAPGPQLIRDGDLGVVQAPIDFLGVNYYAPHIVAVREDGIFRRGDDPMPWRPGATFVQPDHLPVTAMGWLVDPNGLYDLLIRVHDDAPGLPLYITENGAACYDYVDPDGAVEDPERVSYLHGHLDACRRAIADGVPLRGYFAWSLMDNFEWAHGYSKRFGLVFVDYGTQRRIPKRSAAWYSEVARMNSLPARG